MEGDYTHFVSSDKLKVNYLILSKNSPINIESLKTLFDFELIVLDSSIPGWKQEIIKRDCEAARVPYFNVSAQGAFVWTQHSGIVSL